MSTILKMFLIIILLFQLILVVNTVRKKQISMKYASLWIVLVLAMCMVVIFPQIVMFMSELMGFETTSNMVLLLGFFFSFYMIYIHTISISVQNEKIKLLIQEISILKEKLNDDGKKD